MSLRDVLRSRRINVVRGFLCVFCDPDITQNGGAHGGPNATHFEKQPQENIPSAKLYVRVAAREEIAAFAIGHRRSDAQER